MRSAARRSPRRPGTAPSCCPGAGCRCAAASAPPERFVGWVYADPDGSEHHTVNCSIADMRLSVSRGGGAASELAVPGGAAYELGMREHDHGIPIQPFPDGRGPPRRSSSTDLRRRCGSGPPTPPLARVAGGRDDVSADGDRFTSSYAYGPHSGSAVYEIVERTPPRRQVVRSVSGPFRFEGRSARPDVGGTRVRQTVVTGRRTRWRGSCSPSRRRWCGAASEGDRAAAGAAEDDGGAGGGALGRAARPARRRRCARTEGGRAAGWGGAPRTPRHAARGGTRPSRRYGQLGPGVLAVELLHAPLEPGAIRDRAALGRGERAQLAGALAAARVCLRLVSLDARDGSLDPHLATDLGPVEDERALGVGLELAALAAGEFVKNSEPALVGPCIRTMAPRATPSGVAVARAAAWPRTHPAAPPRASARTG